MLRWQMQEVRGSCMLGYKCTLFGLRLEFKHSENEGFQQYKIQILQDLAYANVMLGQITTFKCMDKLIKCQLFES